MSAQTTCAPAFNRSGKLPESCGMRIAARMPMTAIVKRSSMSVRPRRGICAQPWPAILVQRRAGGLSAGIGLASAAAQQCILLAQQLLDFPQLANLVGPLLDRIGERGLP